MEVPTKRETLLERRRGSGGGKTEHVLRPWGPRRARENSRKGTSPVSSAGPLPFPTALYPHHSAQLEKSDEPGRCVSRDREIIDPQSHPRSPLVTSLFAPRVFRSV